MVLLLTFTSSFVHLPGRLCMLIFKPITIGTWIGCLIFEEFDQAVEKDSDDSAK